MSGYTSVLSLFTSVVFLLSQINDGQHLYHMLTCLVFFKKNYFYPVLQNLYIPESSEALSLVLLTKLLRVLRKLFLIRTQKCAIIAQPDG